MMTYNGYFRIGAWRSEIFTGSQQDVHLHVHNKQQDMKKNEKNHYTDAPRVVNRLYYLSTSLPYALGMTDCGTFP